jgi:hypothetical protein
VDSCLLELPNLFSLFLSLLCLLPSMYCWVMEVINLVGRRCMTQSRGGSAWPSKTKKAFFGKLRQDQNWFLFFFFFGVVFVVVST